MQLTREFLSCRHPITCGTVDELNQHSIVGELSKNKTVRYFFASRSEAGQDRRRVQAESEPDYSQRRTRKARTVQKEHVGQQGDHLHGADESNYYYSVNCRCYSKKDIIV